MLVSLEVRYLKQYNG